jgi:hypothetical protein
LQQQNQQEQNQQERNQQEQNQPRQLPLPWLQMAQWQQNQHPPMQPLQQHPLGATHQQSRQEQQLSYEDEFLKLLETDE